MKIWVTGSTGMLGRRVARLARESGYEVLGTSRWQCPIDELGIVMRTAQEFEPDVIINCAGALPGTPSLEMVTANSLGPHNLAYLKTRLVHMSTDCVYSGRGIPSDVWLDPEQHAPTPDTLYARSKLAGEPSGDHVLVVRGSFVGPEHGFLRWLLDSEGKSIDLWAKAWWNGGTATEMARALVALAQGKKTGVLHVASDQKCSKASLAHLLVGALKLDLKTTLVREPLLNRALRPQYVIPGIHTTLPELLQEVKACLATA